MILKIGLHGASGKMGQEVTKLVDSTPAQFKIEQNYDRNFFARLKYAEPNGKPKAKSEAQLKPNVDVVVDFSLPEALSVLCDYCLAQKIPLVSGTTGLKENHFEMLLELS